MKINRYICALILASSLVSSCKEDDGGVRFGIDNDKVEIGPDGGAYKVAVTSSDDWIATTDDPWITISPANGHGSVVCEIQIDSALTDKSRTGYVRIENQSDWSKKEIAVNQEGYPYIIAIEDNEVSLENYADYDHRSFEVKVRTNVDFNVVLPDNAGWLDTRSFKLDLDRGIRPRNVTLKFNWKVNSAPMDRTAEVSFKPKKDVALAHADVLKVLQAAAEPIEAGTRVGDSLAVIGIARALDMWASWQTSEPLDNWDFITLWEPGMKDYTPEKNGRVKAARFFMFKTKEGLPYEVQYLTAADELYFYSNTNSFLLSLSPGDYIAELPQLKRLTIGAYGLTELPVSFKKLTNLEYLNLSGNNFQKIPSIITKENFPKLHSLNINANQRHMIYDLSNTVTTNFGGLFDEQGFPRHLLEWNELDTLVVSVNYLQGSIPDMQDWEKYTEADIAAADTLPQALVGTPKVLPKMKHLAINLNRLTGTLPDWILYHPSLNWWLPYIFVFSQEGKDVSGRSAGFDNEPANLNYYYDFYKGFKNNDVVEGEDETPSMP